MSDLQHFRTRLAEAHANARRLRCEAFVRYTPVIAGQRLLPITLDTYNLLIAWENPFVVGGHCEFHHLFQFIWAHSPAFGQFSSTERRICMRSVLTAIRPRRPNLNAMCRALAPFRGFRWLSRFCRETQSELEAVAIEECSRLVAEAIGEFPTERPSDKEKDSAAPTEPLPFSLQAQILNLMRRELGLSFAETRSLPLKELSQHLREITWTTSGGKAVLLNRAEAEVWSDYQEWREKQAAEAAAESPPEAPQVSGLRSQVSS